jgi:hypothetical protein
MKKLLIPAALATAVVVGTTRRFESGMPGDAPR